MSISTEQALDNRLNLERAAKLKHNPQFDQDDKAPNLASLMLQVISRLDVLISSTLANKAVLTIEEAAAYTGITVSTIYKLTSTQAIPFSKPRGKMLYFNRAELDNWLMGNRVQTVDEIDQAAVNHVNHFKPAAQDQSKRFGTFAGGAQ